MLPMRRMCFRAVTVINIAACYALIIEVHAGDNIIGAVCLSTGNLQTTQFLFRRFLYV